MTNKRLAFLSYASEDLKTVERLYRDLVGRGAEVWFDKQDLLPGEWKPQIEKAIAKSNVFLCCISNSALRKIGGTSVQENELARAFKFAENQSERDFVIIPIRLEDVGRGDNRLSLYQQYDLYKSWTEVVDRLVAFLGCDANTTFVETLFSKANTFYTIGEPETCLRLINAAEGIGGVTLGLSNNKASALHALGRLDESLREFDEAISRWPEDALLWRNRANVLRSMERFEEALPSAEKSISLKPSAEAFIIKGSLQFLLDRSAIEAIRSFDAALLLDPSSVEAFQGKAEMYTQLKQYDRVYEATVKATTIAPDCLRAHELKGLALLKLDRYAEALEAFEKAVALGSKDAPTFALMGIALLDLNRPSDALRELERAIQMGDRDPLTYSGMMGALVQLGRFEDACLVTDKLIEIDPGNCDLYVFKGNLLIRLGRRSEAASAFNWALHLNSNHQKAKEGLEAVSRA